MQYGSIIRCNSISFILRMMLFDIVYYLGCSWKSLSSQFYAVCCYSKWQTLTQLDHRGGSPSPSRISGVRISLGPSWKSVKTPRMSAVTSWSPTATSSSEAVLKWRTRPVRPGCSLNRVVRTAGKWGHGSMRSEIWSSWNNLENF